MPPQLRSRSPASPQPAISSGRSVKKTIRIMTNQKIVAVAGGSGALGSLIAQELNQLGVGVVILARRGKKGPAPPPMECAPLPQIGMPEVREVDYNSVDDIAAHLRDVDVVVSALAGLDDAMVGAQGRLVRAAHSAGVRKFVPSDFSIDFHDVPPGDNRNLATRREFLERFEDLPIRKTSVLNGAFSGMLTGIAPFVLFRIRRILCWGNPGQKMDWTAIEDVARYTAHAAIDEDSPCFLRIAGDRMSASDLSTTMSDLTGVEHLVLRPPGGLDLLRALILVTRFFVPGRRELYPPWQGMQYMHNMYSGVAAFDAVDNERYPVEFRSVKDILDEHLSGMEKSTNKSGAMAALYVGPSAGILVAISAYFWFRNGSISLP